MHGTGGGGGGGGRGDEEVMEIFCYIGSKKGFEFAVGYTVVIMRGLL